VFIDSDRQAIEQLRAVLLEWQAEPAAAQCLHTEAARYLAGAPQPFDLVFVDPPFAAGALAASVAQLESRGWLKAGSHVYIEHPRSAPLVDMPASWQPLRSGTAGAVGYDLFERR